MSNTDYDTAPMSEAELAKRQYAQRDTEALGDLYFRHVEAMTVEGLHAKCDIAAELAWRDGEIARLANIRSMLFRRREELWATLHMIVENFESGMRASRDLDTSIIVRARAALGVAAEGGKGNG